ncbi:MAG: hypothetical protein NEHIOOID_00330 [Holosporales bacterium]
MPNARKVSIFLAYLINIKIWLMDFKNTDLREWIQKTIDNSSNV